MPYYSNFTVLILPIAISISGICMIYKTYNEMNIRVNDVFVDPLVAKKTYANDYYALVRKDKLHECCDECTFKCRKLFLEDLIHYDSKIYCIIKLVHNEDKYSDLSKDFSTIFTIKPNFIVYNRILEIDDLFDEL